MSALKASARQFVVPSRREQEGASNNTAARNLKEEFTPPLPVAQCGYVPGFLRSSSHDLTLHIVGAAVTVDSKFSSFDPFIKVTKVAEDGMLRAEDAAAASASDGSATADVPQKFVRRTRVLKNTQQPVWREDFFLGALEYDDLLRLELKLKSKDQGQKTLPNPNLCSVVFSCGDVLDTLGRLDPGEGRVKFQLSGEKASAVLTCVATFDSDVPLVLSALLPPPADARDGKAANRNSGRITSNSNLATACGGNVLSAHCYVSLNHNHTAMLLASEPLVRKAQHD